MYKFYYKNIFYLFLFLFLFKNLTNDVTIVGNFLWNDGLGRIPIIMMRDLSSELEINAISVSKPNYEELPIVVKNILDKKNITPGKISLSFSLLWCKGFIVTDFMPDSPIKIAVSMLQTTLIPPEWTNILNDSFDAVCVPDDFYVDVYKNSGVEIPIFVLPSAIDLTDFLNSKQKTVDTVFTFGMSANFWQHKNHIALIEAFHKEFNNDPTVKLVLHAKFGDNKYIDEVKQNITNKRNENIILNERNLSHIEYIDLLSSFNCYVLVSKGEGFSITPREALAIGIPCIISNNTAQKTLCDSGYVRSVSSLIRKPAYYPIFFNGQCGEEFECDIFDIQKAMRDVYSNYSYYQKMAQKGKEWVAWHDFSHMKQKYLSLIKPKKVVLGKYNKIENDCLITNSTILFDKYKKYILPRKI